MTRIFSTDAGNIPYWTKFENLEERIMIAKKFKSYQILLKLNDELNSNGE